MKRLLTGLGLVLLSVPAFAADFEPVSPEVSLPTIIQPSVNQNFGMIMFQNKSDRKASLDPKIPSPYLIVLNRCVAVSSGKTCAVTVSIGPKGKAGEPSPGKLYSALMTASNASPVTVNTRIINDPKVLTPAALSFTQASYVIPVATTNQRSVTLPVEIKNSGETAAVPQIQILESNSNVQIALNRCVGLLKKDKTCQVYLNCRSSKTPVVLNQLAVGANGQIHSETEVLVSDSPTGGVATPTPSPTATPVSTPEPTPEPTPVATPVPTPEPTPVPTPIATPIPTPTPIVCGADQVVKDGTCVPEPLAYFIAPDVSISPARSAIWETDGSAAGTKKLMTITTANHASPSITGLRRAGNMIYVTGNISSATGAELYRFDPISNSILLVKDIRSGTQASTPAQFTEFNGKMYFTAFDGSAYRIWESDGTPAGTRAVISPSGLAAGAVILGKLNGQLLVSMSIGTIGSEPYMVDPVAQTYTLLKDIFPGTSNSSAISSALIVGNKAYFSAKVSAAEGWELWVTDGSTAGTQPLAILNPGTGNGFTPQSVYIGAGAFSGMIQGTASVGLGTEIYFYDPILNEYHFLIDWNTSGNGYGTPIYSLTTGTVPDISSNKSLYTCYDPATYGFELCLFNGYTYSILKDINPGVADSQGINTFGVRLGNNILFPANSVEYGLSELWTTDGTAAGTQLLFEANPGTGPGNVSGLIQVRE